MKLPVFIVGGGGNTSWQIPIITSTWPYVVGCWRFIDNFWDYCV